MLRRLYTLTPRRPTKLKPRILNNEITSSILIHNWRLNLRGYSTLILDTHH